MANMEEHVVRKILNEYKMDSEKVLKKLEMVRDKKFAVTLSRKI